jgi:hypothetical protein
MFTEMKRKGVESSDEEKMGQINLSDNHKNQEEFLETQTMTIEILKSYRFFFN